MQGSLMLDIEGLWLTAVDRDILRQPQVGGIILFARNIDSPAQVAELCRSIRQLRPDLLIAVDQEGGRVRRLRRGFTPLPSMQAIAAAADPQQAAWQAGWLMAAETLAVGIDFSFAPVLDLDYGRNQVIACRAFSGDPEVVIRLGRCFMQGMQAAGMATVGKHFPGHGWVTADSHVAVPIDERPLERIRQQDLRSFAGLADCMDGVMPAHVIYQQVDPQPAGFSPFWLQQVLRGELGFKGVIFSDDLCMAGAHVAGSMAQRTEAALQAGCDMILVCNDRTGARQALAWMQQQQVAPAAGLSRMAMANSYPAGLLQRPDYPAIKQQVMALQQG